MTPCAPAVATDASHLRALVHGAIKKHGAACDLNPIDVSGIVAMNRLFENSHFSGDISRWNTGNVQTMHSMFKNARFNGNLTNWNVTRVTDMGSMFEDSHLTKDLSRWRPKSATNFGQMFEGSRFSGNLSAWPVVPTANTKRMLPRLFEGQLPADLEAHQWKNVFSGDSERGRYFSTAGTFAPGMSWWLFLSTEGPFPKSVPPYLHRWLRQSQALGRETAMPRSDIALYLAKTYPMNDANRLAMHALVRREYAASCAIFNTLTAQTRMDYETWALGSSCDAVVRWELMMGAQAGPHAPLDALPLPSLE